MSRKFLIITGANTAREINELGDLCPIVPAPTFDLMAIKEREELWIKREKWKNRQSSLKEYRIIGKAFYNADSEIIAIDPDYLVYMYLPEGTKVECDCNDQDLTAIIL